ncbi:hypothetical protein ACFLXQ_01450 [Chloroflexota bacterium]
MIFPISKLINASLLHEEIVVLNVPDFHGLNVGEAVEVIVGMVEDGELTPRELSQPEIDQINTVIDNHDASGQSQEEVLAEHIASLPVQIRTWLDDNPVIEDLFRTNVIDRETTILAWDLTTANGQQNALRAIVALSNMVQLLLYREGLVK